MTVRELMQFVYEDLEAGAVGLDDPVLVRRCSGGDGPGEFLATEAGGVGDELVLTVCCCTPVRSGPELDRIPAVAAGSMGS